MWEKSARAEAWGHPVLERMWLWQSIESKFHSMWDEVSVGSLFKVSSVIPSIDPLDWVSIQSVPKCFFWAERNGAFSVAGTGYFCEFSGDDFTSFESHFLVMKSMLSAATGDIKWYGGMGFSPSSCMSDEWYAFPFYRYFIPLCEVFSQGKESVFSMTFKKDVVIGKNETLGMAREQFDRLSFNVSRNSRVSINISSRECRPDTSKWALSVDNVKKRIIENELEKVVLARQVIVDFEGVSSGFDLLSSMRQFGRLGFLFGFQNDSDSMFLGQTPESLYTRCGEHVISEAIAGTRPRGDNLHDDYHQEVSLLSSTKDLNEHVIVRNMIDTALRPLCRTLTCSDSPVVVKCLTVQHLKYCFEGLLREKNDIPLLRALHPTPAVGGYPTNTADALISSVEPFRRGWYSGLVGWFGRDETQMAVAIRSALREKNRYYIFTGAGIVADSDSTSEWNELNDKLAPYKSILGF